MCTCTKNAKMWCVFSSIFMNEVVASVPWSSRMVTYHSCRPSKKDQTIMNLIMIHYRNVSRTVMYITNLPMF